MQPRDMRPFVLEDPYWNPGYARVKHQEPTAQVPQATAQAPQATARVPRNGLEQILSSAAFAGDSAFIGICFDFDPLGH